MVSLTIVKKCTHLAEQLHNNHMFCMETETGTMVPSTTTYKQTAQNWELD
jgi:hypothetical protein